MEKGEFKKRMEEAGDAVVTYRSQNSRKLKYNVCTISTTSTLINIQIKIKAILSFNIQIIFKSQLSFNSQIILKAELAFTIKII